MAGSAAASYSTPFAMLERPALKQRLDEAFGKRLTLVVAGAGYGKTTLVARWSEELQTVWHTVGPPDRELASFVPKLVEGFRQAGVDTPEELLAAVGSGVPAADDLRRAEGIASLLSQSLATSLQHDLMLVLDDLHELAGAAASMRVIETLCRQAPERLHVLLLSRTEPEFPIARLRGQGEVLELDAADLAFTRDEIGTLAERHAGTTDDGLASNILQVTGGWPALTRLLVEALGRAEAESAADVLERLHRPEGPLFSYLAEEVFGQQDEDAVELLRRTAIFDRFNVELCAAIGLVGAAEQLARLTERGLFVQPKTGEAGTYAVHSLVRDFVQDRWPLSEAERSQLHRAAAIWFEEQGNARAALAEATAAHAAADIARLLGTHGKRLLDLGATADISRAGEIVPPHERDDAFEQVIGDAHSLRGDWDAARACYERIAGDRVSVPAGLAWRLGRIDWDRGEFGEALEQYARADPVEENEVDKALLLSWSAWALWHTGQAEPARIRAREALEVAKSTGSARALAAAHGAGMLAALGHDDTAVREHYELGLQAAEQAGDLLQLIRLHLNRAGPMAPRPALEIIEAALGLTELCGSDLYRAATLLARGLKRSMMGMLDEGISDLEEAHRVLEHHGSSRWTRSLALLGSAHRERGDLALARLTLERALPAAERTRDAQVIAGVCADLARVLALEDPEQAEALVERGLAARRPIAYGLAWDLISAGWVAYARDDIAQASSFAAEAKEVLEPDQPHLFAEALELEAFCSPDPAIATAKLEQAVALWTQAGNQLGRARVELVLGRLAGTEGRARARRAEQQLRRYGIRLETQGAGILAAVPPENPAAVEIRTLGGFGVSLNGTPVVASAWQSKKARDLLKLLLARRGRPVTRELAMETLWPGEEPAKLSNRLSVALSTLRSVLDREHKLPPDHFVRADTASISLDLAHVVVDAELFVSAATKGLAGNREELEDAESLYAGDFLEEDAYEDWTVAVREEARGLYIRVTRTLAEHALADCDLELVVRYLRRILERDPYDEDAHLKLVAGLQSAGQHGEAGRAYRAYVARMEAIGIEPVPHPTPVREQP